MSIIGTLPYDIINGTLANADEVMANFDYIVSQVNANAAAGGSAVTANVEWTLLTDAPTYVSATSFTMAGDQTSAFTVGRRIKSTNTGGTTYSTVIASAAVLNTTVTVVNSSGTLDSGMSSVSLATLNSVDPSVPALTNFSTPGGLTTITSAAAFVVPTGVGVALGDALTEWTSATSRFTPKTTGIYRIRMCGWLNTSATTLTFGDVLQVGLNVNGSSVNVLYGGGGSWPFATGSTTRSWAICGELALEITAGNYAQVYLQLPGGFSGGNPYWTGVLTWERLPYPS